MNSPRKVFARLSLLTSTSLKQTILHRRRSMTNRSLYSAIVKVRLSKLLSKLSSHSIFLVPLRSRTGCQRGFRRQSTNYCRANITIWMLTGDKRETAINVAHTSRICQPDSDIFVLDAKDGDLQGRISAAAEAITIQRAHCVVVIDGHTLTCMGNDLALKTAFYLLIPTVPSVICCRPSPAQKAAIVKAIKAQVPRAFGILLGRHMDFRIVRVTMACLPLATSSSVRRSSERTGSSCMSLYTDSTLGVP